MTPDPIAPDALREAVLAAIARVWMDEANASQDERDDPEVKAVTRAAAEPLADAVLAALAEHRDAEVERLRDQRNEATWALAESPVFMTLHHELDAAQDRITRALAVLDRWSARPASPAAARIIAQLRAALTDTDQEADRG